MIKSSSRRPDNQRGIGFVNTFRLMEILAISGTWMSGGEVADRLGVKGDRQYRSRQIRRWASILSRWGVPIETSKMEELEREGRVYINGPGFWYYRLRRNHMERWLRDIL